MASGWEFILVRSLDMEPIGKIKEAKSRALEVDLNKSGSASCLIPSNEDVAKYVWPWSTAVMVQYDAEPFWSGPVSSRQTSLAAGQVNLAALGWFERLMHLLLQETSTSYTNMDAGAIAADLLAKARAQDPTMPITIGTVETTQLRTITYTQDQNIGQAIQALAELESGYDWYVDPVTRELNIVARRGSVLEDVKWSFIGDGKSQQSNLADVSETVDGSVLVNQIRPRGASASGFAEDVPSEDEYGVFQEAPSLSDVIDVGILEAYGAGEIAYRSQPRVTYNLTPKPSSKASVPRLFRDFDIGDTTFLTARRDFVDIDNQAIRIFGVSLAISDVGTETLSNLQTTAS